MAKNYRFLSLFISRSHESATASSVDSFSGSDRDSKRRSGLQCFGLPWKWKNSEESAEESKEPIKGANLLPDGRLLYGNLKIDTMHLSYPLMSPISPLNVGKRANFMAHSGGTFHEMPIMVPPTLSPNKKRKIDLSPTKTPL